MSAGTKNLIIDQGADWFINFTYKNAADSPINLSDYSAALQLRSSYDAASPALNLSTGFLGIKSTTSDAIGVGSTTFSVSSTSLFSVGTRVRAASVTSPSNFQEGAVASFVTNTSVTITVDLIGGTGTFSNWVFSSAAPGITVTPLLGEIAVHATATQTGAVVAGDYVYDLEITSSEGIVTRIVQGRATVTPQVTR